MLSVRMSSTYLPLQRQLTDTPDVKTMAVFSLKTVTQRHIDTRAIVKRIEANSAFDCNSDGNYEVESNDVNGYNYSLTHADAVKQAFVHYQYNKIQGCA